jgi:hypothetical protein
MNYDLNRLNPNEFEHLVQSLLKRLLVKAQSHLVIVQTVEEKPPTRAVLLTRLKLIAGRADGFSKQNSLTLVRTYHTLENRFLHD